MLCALSALSSTLFAGDHPNQHHHPFQTVQPGGQIITLTYQGDEDFHYYEDEDGYTVVHQRGAYHYADVQGGNLVATPFRVGDVNPAGAGLAPHSLPSPKAMAKLREKSRAGRAARAVPLNDRIPAGSRLIEGCIMVREPAVAGAPGGPGGSPQLGVSVTGGFWPNGLVYYQFDAGVTADERAAMLAAMEAWEAVANVEFISRTTQANYIYIFSGSGNWSYVGMVGGRQDLSIYNWDYQFIMMHELAHALGVWHEQSRSDRNTYVQINTANIQTGMESNFDIQAGSQTNGDYDFDSIMHYGQCAFANCTCSSSCRTITCLAPYTAWQNQIGQKTHLSVGDAANMAVLYGSPTSTSGMAQMISPANGTPVAGGTASFDWDQGVAVQQYRLTVGTSPGLSDLHDQTTGATGATVTGLPIEGGDIHVRLYSQIGGLWYHNSYSYPTDLCPGHADADDDDSDGVPDGCDACPGSHDLMDGDGDSVADGCDACEGSDDLADLDFDGVPDGCDICPVGANGDDADGDGTPDGCDECPDVDNAADDDGDGTTDCLDECPADADKAIEGICGCGTPDVDADGDGTPDCNDGCPFDAEKLEPGADGCAVTGSGVLGGGVSGGGMCGGGLATSSLTLSLSLLWLPMRRRRRA